MARGRKLGDEGGSKEALTALLQARGAGGLVQSSKKGSSNGTAICAEAEWAGGLVQSSKKGSSKEWRSVQRPNAEFSDKLGSQNKGKE